MSDETKQYPVYTFAQRQAGAEKLANLLKEEGIAVEVVAKPGKTPDKDSVRLRVSDKKGTPAGDFTLNAKGFINLGYRYTDGDQKVIARAKDVLAETQDSDISENYIKVKAAPGGGGFLGSLDAE
jgi:hypothetical protein